MFLNHLGSGDKSHRNDSLRDIIFAPVRSAALGPRKEALSYQKKMGPTVERGWIVYVRTVRLFILGSGRCCRTIEATQNGLICYQSRLTCAIAMSSHPH